jgi:hypothetical protein
MEQDQETLHIPVFEARKDLVSFFNCQLLNIGEHVQFSCDEQDKNCLPVIKLEVGSRYVDEILMHPDHGGGFFLEHHSPPHFHMPLTQDSAGFLILAKQHQQSNSYHIAGFKIPFGSAIYSPPHVIHSDAFLIGAYRVVYTTTKEFSTVVFRNSSTSNLTQITYS